MLLSVALQCSPSEVVFFAINASTSQMKFQDMLFEIHEIKMYLIKLIRSLNSNTPNYEVRCTNLLIIIAWSIKAATR